MAIINGEVFTWDDFYKSFLEGDYNEFTFKGRYINVGLDMKGTFRKIKRWVFVVHRHDNTGAEIYSEYKTPELLLENARVDGKTLQEIWNEIVS